MCWQWYRNRQEGKALTAGIDGSFSVQNYKTTELLEY